MAETLSPVERIRIHERIQEACGLISQAEDDLPHEHPAKEELRDLGKRVWVIGYEMILGDAEAEVATVALGDVAALADAFSLPHLRTALLRERPLQAAEILANVLVKRAAVRVADGASARQVAPSNVGGADD